MMRPELLALLIPIIALMIPIVAILVAHQQKMAQIIHANPQNNPHTQAELEAMRREISELKALVHQQTLALDDFSGLKTTTPPHLEDIRGRVGS